MTWSLFVFHVVYDLSLHEDQAPKALMKKLTEIAGVSDVVVISGQSNVDF